VVAPRREPKNPLKVLYARYASLNPDWVRITLLPSGAEIEEIQISSIVEEKLDQPQIIGVLEAERLLSRAKALEEEKRLLKRVDIRLPEKDREAVRTALKAGKPRDVPEDLMRILRMSNKGYDSFCASQQ